MPVIGEPRRFHNKWKFQLEIDDIPRCAFQNCSELKVEITKVEYYEGGMLIPYKEPGRMQFSDLTLERAACVDREFYDWLQDTAVAQEHRGRNTTGFKRNCTIVQYDRNNTRVRTWTVSGCWIQSFTAGSWDNNSDEFVMEQIVLAYDYFVMGPINNNGADSNTKNLVEQGLGAIRRAF